MIKPPVALVTPGELEHARNTIRVMEEQAYLLDHCPGIPSIEMIVERTAAEKEGETHD